MDRRLAVALFPIGPEIGSVTEVVVFFAAGGDDRFLHDRIGPGLECLVGLAAEPVEGRFPGRVALADRLLAAGQRLGIDAEDAGRRIARPIAFTRLAAEQPRAEADKLQVIVGGQAVVGQKREAIARGHVVRTFEDGRAFVDFVEHGHVEHGCACPPRFAELPPQKAAFQAGNFIEPAVVLVVPTEAREDHRHILQAVVAAPLDVGFPVFAGMLGDRVRRVITANGPGTDDVAQAQQVEKGLVVQGVAAERARADGHAANHAATVVAEGFQQLPAVLQRVLPAVVESDAPDLDHGPAALRCK